MQRLHAIDAKNEKKKHMGYLLLHRRRRNGGGAYESCCRGFTEFLWVLFFTSQGPLVVLLSLSCKKLCPLDRKSVV